MFGLDRPGPYSDVILFGFALRLPGGEEFKTKSGIGGVISRPWGDGVRDECLEPVVVKVFVCISGLGLAVRLLDRMRLYGRGGQAITWLLKGDAIMLVPGVAAGGGTGLSDRNNG